MEMFIFPAHKQNPSNPNRAKNCAHAIFSVLFHKTHIYLLVVSVNGIY